MGTKNISLPPEMEAYVDAKVASGEYAHASEVVRDGIRLLMSEEAKKLEWLRAAIAEGLASGEEDAIDGEILLARVKQRGMAALARKKNK